MGLGIGIGAPDFSQVTQATKDQNQQSFPALKPKKDDVPSQGANPLVTSEQKQLMEYNRAMTDMKMSTDMLLTNIKESQESGNSAMSALRERQPTRLIRGF